MGRIEQSSFRPVSSCSSTIFAFHLGQCGDVKCLPKGKFIHGGILRKGYGQDTYLGNLLIQMYGKCGSLHDASLVFHKMHKRNVYSGNIMVAAFAQYGNVEEAREIFDTMPECNVVSWNSMISTYAQNGFGKEALQLFQQMHAECMVPTKLTLVSVLDACSQQEELIEGKSVHQYIVDTGFDIDVVLGTALINMYGKCGRLQDSRDVFYKMQEHNVVSWTAMISVHAQQGCGEEALYFYRQMHDRGMMLDKITLVSILDACSIEGFLAEGKKQHAISLHTRFHLDVILGTALLNMYGKCGSLDDAEVVFLNAPDQSVVLETAMLSIYAQHGVLENAWCIFDNMLGRNIVSWNAMIAAFVQYGYSKEALELFKLMQLEGFIPNKITYVGIIEACGGQAALIEGKQIHARILNERFESDMIVESALLNMYTKCGSLENSYLLFQNLTEKHLISWTSMIAAFAQHGLGTKAFQLFEQMQLDGMGPDKITFIEVLFACSHSGLINESWHCLLTTSCGYYIPPNLEHYNCVIGLFGRLGWLDEAVDLMSNMQFEPNNSSWATMLGACAVHFDLARGQLAAWHALELHPSNAISYVLLSNILAKHQIEKLQV